MAHSRAIEYFLVGLCTFLVLPTFALDGTHNNKRLDNNINDNDIGINDSFDSFDRLDAIHTTKHDFIRRLNASNHCLFLSAQNDLSGTLDELELPILDTLIQSFLPARRRQHPAAIDSLDILMVRGFVDLD